MPERAELIATFLAARGWGTAERGPLADDASFRRYDRLQLGTRRAVLMDAPPPQEDVRPFIMVGELLRDLGYSAPEILARDVEHGLLLLEDLGDDTYTKILADGGDEQALYALAVDVLIDLHSRGKRDTVPSALPRYDEQRLLEEALLLTDWYIPAVLGKKTSSAIRNAYIDAWREVLRPVIAAQPTLVLRDYHVDNLIWLPERDGVEACGLLDFQDAVAGHPAYDLMSLLEDARRDIDPDLFEEMMARYTNAFPGLSTRFQTDFRILAAQRHAKVIGIFTRLCVRDAKPDYLVHIPRVWRLLERALSEPELAPLAKWMETNLPIEARNVPSSEAKVEN